VTQVLIPQRRSLEKELLASVVAELPNLGKEVKQPMANFLGVTMGRSVMGMSGTTITDAANVRDKRAVIRARHLKVGLHNGRTLLRQEDDDFWTYLNLEEVDDGTPDEDDLLQHVSTRNVRLSQFFKHRLCSLVCLLEYHVKIYNKKPKGDEGKTGDSKLDSAPGNPAEMSIKVAIVLGGQVYCPFDGKRLRLRTSAPQSDPAVMLHLMPDDRCRILTTELIFTPAARMQNLLKTQVSGVEQNK
jgi:hypothetical protein